MVYMERFELSKHIADCSWELTNSTEEKCAATPDPDLLKGMTGTLFQSENCDWVPGANYEGDICYHNGKQEANVFTS